METRVLTIKNPWALLIVRGHKDVENRRWKTNFKGKVLIHSSKYPVEKDEGKAILLSLVDKGLITLEEAKYIYRETYKGESNSSILGVVDLCGCVNNSKSNWAEEGNYHFLLKNQVCLKNPIRDVPGYLGLWKPKFKITPEIRSLIE